MREIQSTGGASHTIHGKQSATWIVDFLPETQSCHAFHVSEGETLHQPQPFFIQSHYQTYKCFFSTTIVNKKNSEQTWWHASLFLQRQLFCRQLWSELFHRCHSVCMTPLCVRWRFYRWLLSFAQWSQFPEASSASLSRSPSSRATNGWQSIASIWHNLAFN